jgi:site-specific DNA-methyltransferase (adenine-specific)
MNIESLSKSELIEKCKELGITKCKSKTKNELQEIIQEKIQEKTKNENTTEPFEKYKLIHGDCMVEMKNIKDKSIDMILCDLPYGMTKNAWDVVIPFDKLWIEYNRVIKDNGAIVLFGSQPFTSLMVVSNLKMFRYCLVWEKNKFSDFLNSKRKPMKTNEDIAIFYNKQPTYNPQYWYSTPYTRWNTQTAVDKQSNYGKHKENYVESSDGKRLPTTVLKFNRVERPMHPTQKPTELLEWLIKTYTNENEIVLDNCMGVGSTGVACKNINRRFIGIEIEEKYYEISKTRILQDCVFSQI